MRTKNIISNSRRINSFLFSSNRLEKDTIWNKACGMVNTTQKDIVEKKVIDLFIGEVKKIFTDWTHDENVLNSTLNTVLYNEKEEVLDFLNIDEERNHFTNQVKNIDENVNLLKVPLITEFINIWTNKTDITVVKDNYYLEQESCSSDNYLQGVLRFMQCQSTLAWL